MKVGSHRLRFIIGVALGGGLGVWLAHGFASDARRRVSNETEERKAVIALRACASLVRSAGGEGDPARRVVSAWQAGTPEVARVRLVRGMQLEVSTAAGDSGDQAAPRRLAREEKPLFDRGQRIASAVRINQEEQGSRKEEIEVERLPDRSLSLALPIEADDGHVVGTLEIVTRPPPEPAATPWGLFLVALLAPIAVFIVLGLAIGERRLWLTLASIVCLTVSLFLLDRASIGLVEADHRQGSAAISARVTEQAALARTAADTLGLTAGALGGTDLDVDTFRKPRGELSTGLRELSRSLLAAGLLALGLLLLAGLGALSHLGRTLKRNRQAYFYIAPAIVGMLILVFYPFSYGITLSFTDSNLYNTNKSLTDIWVGLRNYREILGDFSLTRQSPTGFAINYLNFYWTLTFNVIWTICNVTLGVTSGLILALILNTKGLAMRPLYRVLLILPWAMPNYITALIWKGMFHQQFGVVNQALQMVGLPAVNWFDRPFTSFLTALATNSWLSFPFMMVVSLGALQSIPADLYEAARVDGASRWQQFRAITLPSLRPALVPAIILSVVWTFNMFNIIFLVTGGEPGGATEILITQAYKYAFERYRYGYAAAYSTVIFGILLVYGTIQNRLSKATEA